MLVEDTARGTDYGLNVCIDVSKVFLVFLQCLVDLRCMRQGSFESWVRRFQVFPKHDWYAVHNAVGVTFLANQLAVVEL